MAQNFSYGTVRESRRTAIYVVRVKNGVIDAHEADDIAERMREKIASAAKSPPMS